LVFVGYEKCSELVIEGFWDAMEAV
jgi:hypothetical protein